MASVLSSLLPALVLALPVVLGGLLHVAAIKVRLWPGLAAIPLDGGLVLRGRRVFGANKTLRGAVVMVLATALSSWGCAALGLGPVVLPIQTASPLVWGALLGAGYIAGELPNSFLKRQLDIAPGAAAPAGRWWQRPLFWVIDQLDFLAGIVVVTASAGQPLPVDVAITLGVIALVLHPLIAGLMVLLGLKSRVG